MFVPFCAWGRGIAKGEGVFIGVIVISVIHNVLQEKNF